MEQKRLVTLSISKRHSAVGLHPPSAIHLASKQGVCRSCQLTIFYYHLTFRNTNYRKEVQRPSYLYAHVKKVNSNGSQNM